MGWPNNAEIEKKCYWKNQGQKRSVEAQYHYQMIGLFYPGHCVPLHSVYAHRETAFLDTHWHVMKAVLASHPFCLPLFQVVLCMGQLKQSLQLQRDQAWLINHKLAKWQCNTQQRKYSVHEEQRENSLRTNSMEDIEDIIFRNICVDAWRCSKIKKSK